MKHSLFFNFLFIMIVLFTVGCAGSKKKLQLLETSLQAEQRKVELMAKAEEKLRKDLKELKSQKDDEIARLLTIIQQRDDEVDSLRLSIHRRNVEIVSLKEQLEAQGKRIVALPPPPKESRFEDLYQQTIAKFKERQYQSAIDRLESLLLDYPLNSFSDNCQYWIGECYYGLGDYQQAIVEFEKVFSYDDTDKADDAQLKLGLCYKMLGDKRRAREEFNRLIEDYSGSEYIPAAQKYLKGL